MANVGVFVYQRVTSVDEKRLNELGREIEDGDPVGSGHAWPHFFSWSYVTLPTARIDRVWPSSSTVWEAA